MITFVLAAAMVVAALCVAVALDGATTEAAPDVVAHVLAARLLATDQTVPVSLLLDMVETIGEPRTLGRRFWSGAKGARRRPCSLCLVKPELWAGPGLIGSSRHPSQGSRRHPQSPGSRSGLCSGTIRLLVYAESPGLPSGLPILRIRHRARPES
jgi:hypothetical protein